VYCLNQINIYLCFLKQNIAIKHKQGVINIQRLKKKEKSLVDIAVGEVKAQQSQLAPSKRVHTNSTQKSLVASAHSPFFH